MHNAKLMFDSIISESTLMDNENEMRFISSVIRRNVTNSRI